jgi:hypothetical protein
MDKARTIFVMIAVATCASPAVAQSPTQLDPPHEDPMCSVLRGGRNRDASLASAMEKNNRMPSAEEMRQNEEREHRYLAQYGCATK